MNKKGWNKLLNLVFVAAALVIVFVVFVYSTTEIEKAQSPSNYTAMYNSTTTIQEFFPIGTALSYGILYILAFVMVLWILAMLFKFFSSWRGIE